MSRPDRAAPLTALGQGVASDLKGTAADAGRVVGIGIDAVDVDRFRLVLDRRWHLPDRLFTEGEQAYARAAADPVPRMSTRFAAKEAVMKALGVGLGAFRFTEVEVVRTGLDAPELLLHGAAGALASRAGVDRWLLSLTHTAQVALAVVVAVDGAAMGAAAGSGVAAVPAARP
ncbi:MAG TPA: holo-ACP synthase [Acidimicrobiales bacterium]